MEKVNALEPREPELEAAATAYVEAVTALEPLLKEADDYYSQQDYKDDRMAKGRALHPRLVSAWNAFAKADERLRNDIDEIQDRHARARLVEIEKTEGIKDRYHVEAVMLTAKYVLRSQKASPPDVAAFVKSVDEYAAILKATDDYVAANKGAKIGSSFVRDAKTFLTTAKMLMRRVRDKVPTVRVTGADGVGAAHGWSRARRHASHGLQPARRQLQSRCQVLGRRRAVRQRMPAMRRCDAG